MAINFVLFDSNILVYVHNLRSPFYEKARDLQEKVVFGKLKAAISVQNLLEFYSVVTSKNRIEKPLSLKEARNACLKYLTSGFEVLYPKEAEFQKTLLLAEEKKITARKIFDVYLVATMLLNGIDTIYTANDKDFKIFKEIQAINPFK